MDAIIGSHVYSDTERIRAALEGLGFRLDMSSRAHAHRWLSPSGIPFDLVPAGEHLAASGSPWDAIAIDTAVETEVEPGMIIRHVSAPAFLAMKWAAHSDRGTSDPLLSDDLEDILALLASRPAIVEEVAAAPSALTAYVMEQSRAFLQSRDAQDLLDAHLSNAQDPSSTIAAVRTLLGRMAPP
ncbi:MAG: hypothetical protein HY700_10910 [Gemmatimonadetes bacterium]|nr:hypothetical protein [Gemmatimonadota bacterium]